MINKVLTMLEACNVPVDYNNRPDFDETNMSISFHFFNESGETFEEGEEIETSGTLQIDLFVRSREDFTGVKKQIKQLLKVNRFLSPTSDDTQENIEGIGLINHIVIKSNYAESEVLNNG